MIYITTIKAPANIHSVVLVVEQSRMALTVKAGSFRISGQGYTLDEDFKCVISPGSHVMGYLVENKNTGDVSVVIEETNEADNDTYDWISGEYNLLHSIFNVTVPSDVTTLDDVPINVFEIKEPVSSK